MTERNYRKLTRFLFLLLFAVFLLLYLLLGGKLGGQRDADEGFGVHGAKKMGVVELSDVLSSGFIVDEFAFTKTTSLQKGTQFDRCLQPFEAEIKNIADVPVQVKLRISGTDISSSTITNAGLHCFLYYYSGDQDPYAAGGYRAALTAPGSPLETTSHEELDLTLTTDPLQCPLQFQMDPQEELHLMLVFWVDHDEALARSPALAHQLGGMESDVVDVSFNDQYNVTVKLTSRAAQLP
ncbi:MAG: hypothetical protein RSC08_04755 [Oscillospiraceae bacterium]